MNKLYQQSRKIHRITMFVLIALGLAMSTTGLLLKYINFSLKVGIDTVFIRNTHSTVSGIFVLTLVIMALTGLVMYVVPLKISKEK